MSRITAVVARLTPACRRALEGAAQLAVAQSQATVEAEHLLRKLVDAPDGDWPLLVRHYALDTTAIRRDLDRAVDSFARADAPRAPALSPTLMRWLEAGWLVSSLAMGQARLRSGALLSALLDDDAVRKAILPSAPLFARLSRDAVAAELAVVLTGSAEECGDAGAGPEGAEAGALDLYTQDLTAAAAAGKVDPVVGRDAEIAQVIDVLMRRRQNNPILTGEAGIGKTAIVEGFAQRVVQRRVPPALKGVRVLALDLGLLQAGAGVQGEFERRLKAVIAEVDASPQPIILFIDEAHTLIGAGGSAGHADAANLLKPALARGELRTIAATTWAEYKRYVEKDPALARRFQVVKVAEPTEDVAVLMLQALAPKLEAHHGVAIAPQALAEAVRLSHRYITGRQLPDKAVGVLDTACARAAIAQSEGRTSTGAATVDRAAVAAVVAGWTGVPVSKMLGDPLDILRRLPEQLGARVVGQQPALDAIARRLKTFHADLGEPGKPAGVFLLVGPSGVGKTETACALADILYGGEQAMVTINMSEYQEAHAVAGLKGAPPGYVGYGQGGVLTEAVRRAPYSVVLLDEVEKAHADVLELFYQVFDKGVLDDSDGQTADFRNTLILLTCNLGHEVIARLAAEGASPEAMAEAVRPTLSARFKPALLGRMIVVPYLPLAEDRLAAVVRLKLARLGQRLRVTHGAELVVDDAVVAQVAARALGCDSGARRIDAILSNTLMPELSGVVLDRVGTGAPLDRVRVGLGDDGGFTYAVGA